MMKKKRVCITNSNHKKAGVAIVLSVKRGFKTKNVNKDKERHLLITRVNPSRRIQQLQTYVHLKTKPKTHEAKANRNEERN